MSNNRSMSKTCCGKNESRTDDVRSGSFVNKCPHVSFNNSERIVKYRLRFIKRQIKATSEIDTQLLLKVDIDAVI
uniref:Uncharacterized protein n=1 Tax=Knipowitschia caucasica TaxID=637954 RepID=A0AAV2L6G4_KNICA